VVAAAGNTAPKDAHRHELAFPARFGNVVAISSINSRGKLSSFSRYGDLDQGKKPHQRRFVLPGGDTGAVRESIGAFEDNDPRYGYGTSIAAAYGSGWIARLLAQHGVETLASGRIWSLLRDQATRKGLGGEDDTARYGHGLLKLL